MASLPLQLSGDISGITDKLEELKLAAAKDSMGEAAAGIHVLYNSTCTCTLTYIACLCVCTAMLNELQNKIESLQMDLNTVKVGCTCTHIQHVHVEIYSGNKGSLQIVTHSASTCGDNEMNVAFVISSNQQN